MKTITATLLFPTIALAALTGCGSAATAEKILNEVDSARQSIAADRNQLMADLLHDKSVLANNAAVDRAKATLLASAVNGQVPLAAVTSQLDAVRTEVNVAAETRAMNRNDVEALNIAEERATALELGLRIQIEASKGIFGRVVEAIQAYEVAHKAQPPATAANPVFVPFCTTQPGG